MSATETPEPEIPPSPPSTNAVSASEPDWTREALVPREWNPGRRLLRTIRDYQKAIQKRGIIASLQRITAVLRHRYWSVVAGADIPLNSHIAGGLLIPHPNGIVIHPDVEIGPNCLIFQQVTLGTKDADSGVPYLEGHVDIGGGARVLGEIRIGAHAKIGANAVVLTDIPDGATAVGIPAHVLPDEPPAPDERSSREQ
ncbi:MAG: serine acetyltransferase [Lentisphaerae bacterium]|jgi:serine O-acetyltransferase|nr:serine acetyltransferase [Lentisphaerota bacterium]MBT4817042.1 serine acetyltransferase [Lentisphaerota bacterium]MBT5610402.1 serine acetyltransferase [Lentisphaerota bacterium]MBT7056230.1 serine acetyltransferase [Lentisphaerota bacterium]MBT7841848.1 serine acetyltransferase [Lentisphaerota bacterium]